MRALLIGTALVVLPAVARAQSLEDLAPGSRAGGTLQLAHATSDDGDSGSNILATLAVRAKLELMPQLELFASLPAALFADDNNDVEGLGNVTVGARFVQDVDGGRLAVSAAISALGQEDAGAGAFVDGHGYSEAWFTARDSAVLRASAAFRIGTGDRWFQGQVAYVGVRDDTSDGGSAVYDSVAGAVGFSAPASPTMTIVGDLGMHRYFSENSDGSDDIYGGSLGLRWPAGDRGAITTSLFVSRMSLFDVTTMGVALAFDSDLGAAPPPAAAPQR